jgi:hypothetical protein
MENLIVYPRKNNKFIADCDFRFTHDDKYYECKFAGDKTIKVAMSKVDGLIPQIKEVECSPTQYNDLYSFCERLALQIINLM